MLLSDSLSLLFDNSHYLSWSVFCMLFTYGYEVNNSEATKNVKNNVLYKKKIPTPLMT